LAGFGAIILWSSLALLTTIAEPPPFLGVALAFSVAAAIGMAKRAWQRQSIFEGQITGHARGGLVLQGGFYMFAKDIEFASPSAAAAVVMGGSAQGPAVWKNADGKSLKDLEVGSGGFEIMDGGP
jgi:hypothetical protein